MSCSTYSRCKLSIIQLGGLLLVVSAANSFASLMPVGPMTFSSNVGTFPTVLTIQNMDTASGCVGFMDGSDVRRPCCMPGRFHRIRRERGRDSDADRHAHHCPAECCRHHRQLEPAVRVSSI